MFDFKTVDNHRIFEAILNGLSDAVLVVDESRTVIFSNQALKGLFNLRFKPEGRDVMEVVLDHRISNVIERALEKSTAVSEELTVTLPHEGRSCELILLVDAEPLQDAASGARIVRVVIRDETQRCQIEQVRRDFVANASHELRTPLSIINGYIENLLDGALENQALAKRFLHVMKKHGDRIARIVEDMLTLSKLESTLSSPTQSSAFDLQACVLDVIERLLPVIEEKRADVTIVTEEGTDFFLAGDRFYWDQIFFNLIENSLKQNFQLGLKISIRLVSMDEDTFQISVIDNGVGIPQGDLPYIFRRFYRVEKHHSQEIKGTGLGLSIVKRAVEAHHGSIKATSIPGEETAFVITVPKGSTEGVTEEVQEEESLSAHS